MSKASGVFPSADGSPLVTFKVFPVHHGFKRWYCKVLIDSDYTILSHLGHLLPGAAPDFEPKIQVLPMQKLVIPLEMRGWQGVYNLQRKVPFLSPSQPTLYHMQLLIEIGCFMQIADAAPRGLRPVNAPTQMKFPMPVSLESSSERDSLESEETGQPQTKSLNLHLSPELKASIQGAQAAANQFRR